MSKPIADRFPAPALNTLPADIRERLLATQEKAGFIPNVMMILARRPEEFRAFFAYHDTLMEKEIGLSKAEREMIVVATSAANQCHYCVIAHGAILRIRAKNPLVADQVAINYLKADITVRPKAMLDFAMNICRRPISMSSPAMVSATRTSGTSSRSPVCSPSPTGSPTARRCAPMTNFT